MIRRWGRKSRTPLTEMKTCLFMKRSKCSIYRALMASTSHKERLILSGDLSLEHPAFTPSWCTPREPSIYLGNDNTTPLETKQPKAFVGTDDDEPRWKKLRPTASRKKGFMRTVPEDDPDDFYDFPQETEPSCQKVATSTDRTAGARNAAEHLDPNIFRQRKQSKRVSATTWHMAAPPVLPKTCSNDYSNQKQGPRLTSSDTQCEPGSDREESVSSSALQSSHSSRNLTCDDDLLLIVFEMTSEGWIVNKESFSQQLRSERTRAGADITCHICHDSGDDTWIPSCPNTCRVTQKCQSDRTVCKACLERYIEVCVSNQNFDKIVCICNADGACSAVLSYEEVKRYASAETFQRYDAGLLLQELAQDPDFCWCARPGCGSGQLHPPRQQEPIVQCHSCKFKTCFRHQRAWHEGFACHEYDAMLSAKNTLKRSNKQIRVCSRCHQGVEKNGGCDHITCLCGNEFCWHCSAPYEGRYGIRAIGSAGHKSTCRYSVSASFS